ncbi:MAG TPA: PaaI family thioesterase [Streptosporangiaceae bacterium]|jgi:uncharacterized protein (TIGR00369 family)
MTAAEVRSVTLSWQPAGPMRPDLSGLDQLRGWRDGSIVMPPIGQALGVRFGEIEPGRVQFEMPLQEYMTNHWGVVLGGMLAVGLDTALGCAVMAAIPADRDMATLDLKVEFLRTVHYRDRSVLLDAECTHLGHNRVLAAARLTTPGGHLCALGTANALIRPKQTQPRDPGGERNA